ncbi:MAG: hypothetical protein QM744_12175 [Mesorhizobium sp.]
MSNATAAMFNPATDDLDSLEKALNAHSKAAKSGPIYLDVSKTKATVQISGGVNGAPVKMEQMANKVQTATTKPGLPAGMIEIDGMVTTIDAAVAGGLISREEAQAAQGFKQPAKATKPEAGQPKTQEVSDNDATISEAEKAVHAASASLVRLDEALGSEAVDAVLGDVAETGEIDFDSLPEGVDQGQAIQVIGGFIASAQSTLKGVGASIDLIDSLLTPEELRECRHATVAGDHAKLRHYGSRAVELFANLPISDPEAFQEMVDLMTPAERKALTQGEEGDWRVTIPGKGTMAFGVAVRQGLVRV